MKALLIAGYKGLVRRAVSRLGARPPDFPPDFDARAIEIIRAVRPYTMTSAERLFALIQAVRYVSSAGVPGSIVECGVWRGGSIMAAALALLESGDTERELFLFDTFEGMSPPTAADVAIDGQTAAALLESPRSTDVTSPWCYAGLPDVRANLLSTGYPADRLHSSQNHSFDLLSLLQRKSNYFSVDKVNTGSFFMSEILKAVKQLDVVGSDDAIGVVRALPRDLPLRARGPGGNDAGNRGYRDVTRRLRLPPAARLGKCKTFDQDGSDDGE